MHGALDEVAEGILQEVCEEAARVALSSLSSLSSPSQSTEALTPTGPEASGASASQRQSRRSSGLASIHRLRQSLVRGPQIDQVLSELKLPQANRSLAARRTPAL